jgi:hypothetical protein
VSIPLAASAYRVECRSERQPSGLASPLNHASNAHPAEAFAPFIDEDVGDLHSVSLLLPVGRGDK